MNYTQEQIEFLKRNLPDHTHSEMVELFNKKFPEVEFDVVKSRYFSKNNKIKSVNDGRFKKGQPAPNKGKKWDEFMPAEAQKKSRQTCFKKGNKPLNWKPVGSTRKNVDGYWEIKVEEPKKWMLWHRYVWEQENGPVPAGNVVIFLDNNRDNVTLDNLAMITMSEACSLNLYKMKTECGQLTEAGIKVVRLKQKIKELENARSISETEKTKQVCCSE